LPISSLLPELEGKARVKPRINKAGVRIRPKPFFRAVIKAVRIKRGNIIFIGGRLTLNALFG
jgi:hypothetical protein